MNLSGLINSTPALGSWGERLAVVRHRFRSEPFYNSSYSEALKRDGIIIIPKFLPAYQFEELCEEYKTARRELSSPRIREWEDGGCWNWSVVFTKTDPLFKKTNSALRHNDFIERMVNIVTRQPVDYWPSTMSYLYQSMAAHVNSCTDDSSVKHQDVRYPTVKVVLYMNSVSGQNAPFLFWRKDSDQPIRVIEPENTLIIADHSHFHSRGQFGNNGHRITLRISFRYLESFRYRHRRLLDRIWPHP